VRIKQRLSLQKDTCQGKQSIRDTTESTTMRVATFAQRRISGPTLGIALGGDTCPVIGRGLERPRWLVLPSCGQRGAFTGSPCRLCKLGAQP
jgi:hypothetical protein